MQSLKIHFIDMPTTFAATRLKLWERPPLIPASGCHMTPIATIRLVCTGRHARGRHCPHGKEPFGWVINNPGCPRQHYLPPPLSFWEQKKSTLTSWLTHTSQSAASWLTQAWTCIYNCRSMNPCTSKRRLLANPCTSKSHLLARQQPPVNSPFKSPVNGLFRRQSPANGLFRKQSPVNGLFRKQFPINGLFRKQFPINGLFRKQSPINIQFRRQSPINIPFRRQSPVNIPFR